MSLYLPKYYMHHDPSEEESLDYLHLLDSEILYIQAWAYTLSFTGLFSIKKRRLLKQAESNYRKAKTLVISSTSKPKKKLNILLHM